MSALPPNRQSLTTGDEAIADALLELAACESLGAT
jgi:hypothetical protein